MRRHGDRRPSGEDRRDDDDAAIDSQNLAVLAAAVEAAIDALGRPDCGPADATPAGPEFGHDDRRPELCDGPEPEGRLEADDGPEPCNDPRPGPASPPVDLRADLDLSSDDDSDSGCDSDSDCASASDHAATPDAALLMLPRGASADPDADAPLRPPPTPESREERDWDAAADDLDGDGACARDADDETPPSPRDSPSPRSHAIGDGRSERRRARAAVAGRDAAGRFVAGRPRAIELGDDAAAGEFYARYRDGYADGEPWPGAEPAPPGRVLYGGLGDSRPGVWERPEVAEARRSLEGSGLPAPVWAPELGDPGRQYELVTRMLFSPGVEAMGWLQNPRVAPADAALDQACCQSAGAGARSSSSFITGTVTRAVPHLGYAMAAGRFGWGLAHAAAAVAMSRRYDRAQKSFLAASLRRAYAPLLAREHASRARRRPGAAAPDPPGAARPPSPDLPAGGAAAVVAAQRRLAALMAPDAGAGPAADADAPAAPEEAECAAACRAVLEALVEGFGGDAAAVPGLRGARPSRRRGARAPWRPAAWLAELRAIRDALVLMRLRGDLRGPGGDDAAVAAVRAVCLAAGALARRRAARGSRAPPAPAAAAADLLLRGRGLRSLLGGAGAADGPASARGGAPPRKRKKSSAGGASRKRRRSPQAGGSRGAEPPPPPPPPPMGCRCPPRGPGETHSSHDGARVAPSPPPSRAPGRAAALAPRPQEGPDPAGGWRRQPPGPSHTPAPGAAALEAYCPPRIAAELTAHALFPEPWRAALLFDPAALASLAARRAAPEPGSGRAFGPLRVSGPLRRAAAWMRQVPDPEEVRVLVLYAPLPGEELGGASPAPPAWTAERGGLSFLLAALANRRCTPASAAWAGNWTGPPDVSALNARGVLLLSTRDLAFAGAVEFLGLLASAADRRLVVINTVPEDVWPRDGPALALHHEFLPCAVRPAAQCDLRWPGAADLRRAVLASPGVFGPGLFARAEAAHARLNPGAPPLRLGRAGDVRFCVRTRVGEATRVPLTPREYRLAALPALDARTAASSAAAAAMAPGAADFRDEEAHSHRACARWGLGAALRPVYLALPRGAARAAPEAVPAALRAFCAAALLEPDPEAAPLVLDVGGGAPPAPPGIRWASAAGRLATTLLEGDRAWTAEPPCEP
ncbi:transcriptional regulator ICP4 [Bovine alphaherpesvirus 2]|uniref:Transcriptional regulator ICP4 n=1 Tax=Bovine alphaherpesvirus 2 TaxID=10295 RepID=A0A7T1L7L0_9ALPH|nr:transcriptional regulator ICP4 [Bovine alphaherpesvirus 2]QPO25282.1 transcriptional regulator ICP4 [Bovine alphaherpesvirus 2]